MTEYSESIHDISHARAVLKGLLRKHKEKCAPYTYAPDTERAKSRLAAYKETVEWLRNAAGEGLIYEAEKGDKKKKRKIYCSFAFETLAFREFSIHDHEIKTSIPVVFQAIDSKYPGEYILRDTAFILSEHLLCRVLMREKCRSIRELAKFFKPLTVAFVQSEVTTASLTEDAIILFGNGYYALVYDHDDEMLVVKTWVGKGNWTPRNEAKLSLLAENLDRERKAILLTVKDFERTTIFTPEIYLKKAVDVTKSSIDNRA